MAEDEVPPDDYEVGFRKPPKHTQFKKGQSGNPSGKRKRDETVREMLRRLAGEEVVVQQYGAPVTMTRDEAMLTSVLMKAMKGDLGAARFVVDHLGHELEGLSPPELDITKADLGVLETVADWRELAARARSEMTARDDRRPEGGDADDDAFEDF